MAKHPSFSGKPNKSYRFVNCSNPADPTLSSGLAGWVPPDLFQFLDLVEGRYIHWIAKTIPNDAFLDLPIDAKTTYRVEKRASDGHLKFSYLEYGKWVNKPAVMKRERMDDLFFALLVKYIGVLPQMPANP